MRELICHFKRWEYKVNKRCVTLIDVKDGTVKEIGLDKFPGRRVTPALLKKYIGDCLLG